MKLSFETPLCMLGDAIEYNDYEFLLYHMLEEYPEYKAYATLAKSKGKFIILDNSAYELGENYDMDKFVLEVQTLKPDIYILPDVIGDYKATIKNSEKFLKKYVHDWNTLPTKEYNYMGVIQGSNYKEYTECYRYFDGEGCDMIGIPHAAKSLASIALERYPYVKANEAGLKTLGRLVLINKLTVDGHINFDIRHHLLGVNLPIEIFTYKDIPWIYSADTSNPVAYGIESGRYGKRDYTDVYSMAKDKPKIKMNDCMEIKLKKKQRTDILSNINVLKESAI